MKFIITALLISVAIFLYADVLNQTPIASHELAAVIIVWLLAAVLLWLDNRRALRQLVQNQQNRSEVQCHGILDNAVS